MVGTYTHTHILQLWALKTDLLLSHLSYALKSRLRKISVKTTKIIVCISIMKLFRYFVWSNSLWRHVSIQQLKEITTEHKMTGVTNYTSLETMTKMCHLSVSYTRALTGQPIVQEFKACGRSSDCMKSKQIRSIAMGRMTSHCIEFKAGYCQETCKAVGVCTRLILEIPWNQTKNSIGKADGGLKHSLINSCQNWAGVQSSVFHKLGCDWAAFRERLFKHLLWSYSSVDAAMFFNSWKVFNF